jgi:phosphoribosylglycinamide formyltransferase 1
LFRLAVLASGRGSNFEAIYSAIKAGKLSAEIVHIISDNPKAKILDTAKSLDLPLSLFAYKSFPTKEEYEKNIINKITEVRADLIVLAGYMRILSPDFVKAFAGKIINIHPALLPAFPGLHAQKQALDYGVKISGCTVHFVDSGVDTGRIIMQKAVPVLDTDTEETLSQRILTEEHDLYWRAIKLVAEGKVKL